MPPLRVLHVQRASGVAGSERHLLDLLPGLRASGVDAQLATVVTGRGDEFVDAMRARDVPAHRVPGGSHLDPMLFHRLRRLVRELQPDVVHTHLIDADVYGQVVARRTGIPAVSSVHGVPTFYGRPPYRQVGRAVGRLPSLRIAISHHVRRFLEDNRLARADRIRVIHYGIDAEQWRRGRGGRQHARRALALASDDVVVGMAARMIEGKGHATVLRAVALLAERFPRLRLVLAGDGPLRPQLEELAVALVAASNARVDFLGYVDDMRCLMHACDVVVFPTEPPLGEGFGLAALEAQAAGCPVVASDWCSLPEVVADRETGLLFRPGSVQSLADALALLAGDAVLRQRLGDAAAERARTTFPQERTVDATVEVYGEVVGARRLAVS